MIVLFEHDKLSGVCPSHCYHCSEFYPIIQAFKSLKPVYPVLSKHNAYILQQIIISSICRTGHSHVLMLVYNFLKNILWGINSKSPIQGILKKSNYFEKIKFLHTEILWLRCFQGDKGMTSTHDNHMDDAS